MIVIENLSLEIAGRCLIDRLSLRLSAGERWVLLGKNGSGKSSLLRTLAGLMPIQRGRIWLKQQELARLSAEALAWQRAYLAQEQSDAFGLSVLETVMLGRFPQGGDWEKPDELARVQAALARLDLAHLALRDVRSLSGGERQRVALAMTLVQATDLLLLDEPSNHLDIAHQALLLRILRETAAAGRVWLTSLHDPNLARAVGSHALMLLPEGRWRAGPIDEVMSAGYLSECYAHPIHDEAGYFRPAL